MNFSANCTDDMKVAVHVGTQIMLETLMEKIPRLAHDPRKIN